MNLGLRAQSISKMKDSLAITKQIVGNRHPYYLFVLGQLGCLLSEHGQHDEAFELLTESIVLASNLRFLPHPKMLVAYGCLIRSGASLGKDSQLERFLAEWLNAHSKADPGSKFYIDALLLSSHNDFAIGDFERGMSRINRRSVDTARFAPVRRSELHPESSR